MAVCADTTISFQVADDPWFSVREGARYIGVHRETLYDWIRSGFCRCARIGPSKRLIRLRRSWLDAALAAATEPVEVR